MKQAKGAFITANHDPELTVTMSARTYAKSAYIQDGDNLIPAVAIFKEKQLRSVLTAEDALRVASKIADILAEHKRLAA